MLASNDGVVEEKSKVVSAYEDDHYLFIITEKSNSLCKEDYVEE